MKQIGYIFKKHRIPPALLHGLKAKGNSNLSQICDHILEDQNKYKEEKNREEANRIAKQQQRQEEKRLKFKALQEQHERIRKAQEEERHRLRKVMEEQEFEVVKARWNGKMIDIIKERDLQNILRYL